MASALNATQSVNSIIRTQFYNTYAEGRVFAPYDCSHQSSTGTTGNLTKYCLQSRFYSCATKVHCPIKDVGGTAANCPLDGQLKLAQFFPCAENAAGGHSDWADAIPCAQKFGLDVDAITKCYDPSDVSYTSEPMTVINAIGNATKAANPKVQFFPDVRINGEQLGDTSAKGIVAAVCAAYKGFKPAACNEAT